MNDTSGRWFSNDKYSVLGSNDNSFVRCRETGSNNLAVADDRYAFDVELKERITRGLGGGINFFFFFFSIEK